MKNKIYRLHNPEGYLWTVAKSRAKKQKLEFSITKYDIRIPEICPLLGIPIVYRVGEGHNFDAPSIDKKDNLKGYTRENIWVISKRANTMKNSASVDELKEFAKNILEKL